MTETKTITCLKIMKWSWAYRQRGERGIKKMIFFNFKIAKSSKDFCNLVKRIQKAYVMVIVEYRNNSSLWTVNGSLC
jgi:hypothetical protein